MRKLEADWLRSAIEQAGVAAASPMLHLGSSTAEFREVRRPHIHNHLFAPLQRGGFEVIHADLKSAPGVDLVGDIFDPEFVASLRSRGFRSVLLSNLLEHVSDPRTVARICEEIVGKGGLIFVSGPYDYPFHADPIDTMFRPTPRELATIFTRSELFDSKIIADGGPIGDIVAGGGRSVAMFPIKLAWRLFGFPFRPLVARTEWSRLMWFGRSYSAFGASFKVVA